MVNGYFLPKPTGSFGVGSTQHHLIDATRVETNKHDSPRELMAYVWYPTNTKFDVAQQPYDRFAITNFQSFIHAQSGIPAGFLVGLQNTKTYEQPGATIAAERKKYPVIIVSHGRGPMIQQYSVLCQELASHGFIVVGVNHPYMAAVTEFPDGRVISSLLSAKKKQPKEIADAWKNEQFEIAVQDIKFLLNSLPALNRHIDVDRIGMCGHSAAGSLAMRMALEDKRIKAIGALDSTMRGNPALEAFATPCLAIIGERSHAWVGDKGKDELNKLFQLSKKPGMNMQVISYPEAGHAVFFDLPFLLNQTLLTRLFTYWWTVDMNTTARRGCEIAQKANQEIVKFFENYLLG